MRTTLELGEPPVLHPKARTCTWRVQVRIMGQGLGRSEWDQSLESRCSYKSLKLCVHRSIFCVYKMEKTVTVLTSRMGQGLGVRACCQKHQGTSKSIAAFDISIHSKHSGVNTKSISSITKWANLHHLSLICCPSSVVNWFFDTFTLWQIHNLF